MPDEIDLNPAMICLVEKMRGDRVSLQHILESDPKDFAEQMRLLTAFQSAVRSIDILSQSGEATPVKQTERPSITLSGILENATRSLTEEDRGNAEQAAALAIGAA